jgi:hypothetical protein
MREFGAEAVLWDVLEEIKDRRGDKWWNTRVMLRSLDEVYWCDTLTDFYGQIAHMSDRYDSLADKVERLREDEEFEERLSRDD